MAAEKKTESAPSVESRLKALYELQTILSEIDRIKTIRGELPLEVKDLEDQIEGLDTRIKNYESEVAELKAAENSEKAKIDNCAALIAKYNEQLNNIRNNREYDMLHKEIEYQKLEVELAEKHIASHGRSIATRQEEIEATRARVDDLKHTLAEKQGELDEIVKETRQEEEALYAKAKSLEPNIDDRTLTAFKRIRKNARNGLGIVCVERNACGGCFNRIPPQKQMEIRMHKKVIVCEYCGRIMIDPALAGAVE